MPFVRVSMRAGKPPAYRQAIFDSIYLAMREALEVPEDDQFMALTEHEAANFRFGAYPGIARGDDLLCIQVTVFNTRTAEQKKELFRCLAQRLGDKPGVRPEDVFVNILESARENWSLGHGIATFA